MKKIILFLLLSCAFPAVSETISDVTFNPTRMGKYDQLRVSRRAVFRGGLHVADPGQEGNSAFKVNSGTDSTITMLNDTDTSPIRRYYYNTINGGVLNGSLTGNEKEVIDMPHATFVGHDPQNQPETLRPVGLYPYAEWYGLPRPGYQLTDSITDPLITYNNHSYPIVSRIVTNGGRFGFTGKDANETLFPSYIGDLITKTGPNFYGGNNPANVRVVHYKKAVDSLLMWANKLVIRPYSSEDYALLKVRGTTSVYSNLNSDNDTEHNVQNVDLRKIDFLTALDYGSVDKPFQNDSGALDTALSKGYESSFYPIELAGFPIPFPGPATQEANTQYDGVAQYRMELIPKTPRRRETVYHMVQENGKFFLDPTKSRQNLTNDQLSQVQNRCFFQWIERMTSGDFGEGKGGETVYVLGLGPCIAVKHEAQTGYNIPDKTNIWPY